VLTALTKLRQLALHPKLTDSSFEEESGKFDELIRTIENLCKENRKVLVFSSFTKHLSLISASLASRKINFSQLTGKTKDRKGEIDKFKNGKDNFVFLISLKAGGTGLNLTEADTVIITDPWWNPSAENQAIARVHRIGQDKKITLLRYISKDTIEEKIMKIQHSKLDLSNNIISSNNPLINFKNEEIFELFI